MNYHASEPNDRTVVSGGQVLDPDRDRLDHLDIEMAGGRIVDIRRTVPSGPRGPDADVRVIDASDRMIVPGFVNAHTHAHNNLLKGLGDCYWLEAHIQLIAREVAGWTPRDYYVSTALGAMEMAATGTTTAFDMVQLRVEGFSECLSAVVQAYRDVGVRANIAPTIVDHSVADGSNVEGTAVLMHLEEIIRTTRSQRMDDEIHLALAPVVHRASDELLRECGDFAQQHDLAIHCHFFESRRQAVQAASQDDMLERLRRHRVLGERTLLAHAVWLDEHGRRVVADAGASVVHNPGSNLKLGSGIAPVREYVDLGVNVALGTDGAASSDNQNMFQAMWLAALLSHSRGPNLRAWLSSREVLEMATIGGSRALGFAGDFGRLQVGARADLLLLDLSSTYLVPLNSPVGQLVYAEMGSAVDRVFVGGREIVRGGRAITVSPSDLLDEARVIGHRLQERRSAEGRAPLSRDVLDRLKQELWASEAQPYPVNRYAGDPPDTRPR